MPMPVLMIGEVPNLSEEVYAGMMGQMMPLMRAHQGFVSHAAGPGPEGGWRVVEVWESEEDGRKWFDENVQPNLPPDVVPDRQYFPLHTAFTR
jgi:heme-degrading monooxygenase HmoA